MAVSPIQRAWLPGCEVMTGADDVTDTMASALTAEPSALLTMTE